MLTEEPKVTRRALLDALTTEAGYAQLHVDWRHPGVSLPRHVTASYPDGRITLDVGSMLAIPCHPVLSETGVDVVLSFDRTPYGCHLPWGSIRMVCWLNTKGQLVGLPFDGESVGATQEPKTETQPGRATKVPWLRVIKGGLSAEKGSETNG